MIFQNFCQNWWFLGAKNDDFSNFGQNWWFFKVTYASFSHLSYLIWSHKSVAILRDRDQYRVPQKCCETFCDTGRSTCSMPVKICNHLLLLTIFRGNRPIFNLNWCYHFDLCAIQKPSNKEQLNHHANKYDY